MNNVRCAGGGQIAKDPAPFGLGPTHYERPTDGDPCGWKGERFASGYRPHVHRPDACGICLIVEERMTAKPCPRCGGKVELIPQDGAA